MVCTDDIGGGEFSKVTKKISVNLYGGKGVFGGRETPLEAVSIFCDMSDRCSYYKTGKCLRHRAFLAPEYCKYGIAQTERGYTSRAAKYYDWKRRITSDPEYGKLNYPNTPVAVIGDYLYLRTDYADVREHKDDKCSYIRHATVEGYDIGDPGFGSCYVFIPLERATNPLLHAIFSYVPYSMMRDIITDYQNKKVPEMLQELHKVAPEIYDRFVSEYPEYRFEPNYVGKMAYVDSLKPGTVFEVKNRGKWLFDGEYVTVTGKVNISTGSPWWLQGGGTAECVKIKVNPQMTFEVLDNSVVDEDTRFV